VEILRAHNVPNPSCSAAIGFAMISAVEGIALTDEMRAKLDGFDRQDLSALERRHAILQSFKDRG
jgi:hypothetical protein